MMALTIKHNFTSPKSDGPSDDLVKPSHWNDSHSVTGTLSESQLSLSDVTTDNVSTAAHGFAPKLPNDSTKYLNGTGTYATPPGTAPGGSDGQLQYKNGSSLAGASGLTWNGNTLVLPDGGYPNPSIGWSHTGAGCLGF